jgi:hypothetical protein
MAEQSGPMMTQYLSEANHAFDHASIISIPWGIGRSLQLTLAEDPRST